VLGVLGGRLRLLDALLPGARSTGRALRSQLLLQDYKLDLRAVLMGKYAGMHDNYMQCLWINVCRDVHKHPPWVQLESAGTLRAACVLLLA
jgi:hypothetical protein